MNNYSFKKIHKNIILVEADTQYNLCSMFLRPQEFYESPYKNIRGHYFTLKEYMEIYTKDRGMFSYYTDWNGFNIPSKSFKKFVKKFEHDFSEKEKLLVDSINNLIPNMNGNFYIIGINKEKFEESSLKHEIAHAYWFLNRSYRNKMLQLIKKIPRRLYKEVYKILISIGYDNKHINDEIQAYFSTSNKNILDISMSNYKNYIKTRTGFKKVFNEYYNRMINNNEKNREVLHKGEILHR